MKYENDVLWRGTAVMGVALMPVAPDMVHAISAKLTPKNDAVAYFDHLDEILAQANISENPAFLVPVNDEEPPRHTRKDRGYPKKPKPNRDGKPYRQQWGKCTEDLKDLVIENLKFASRNELLPNNTDFDGNGVIGTTNVAENNSAPCTADLISDGVVTVGVDGPVGNIPPTGNGEAPVQPEIAGGPDDDDLSYVWDAFYEGKNAEQAIIPHTLRNILNHVNARSENSPVYGEGHCSSRARDLIQDSFLGNNSGKDLYNSNLDKGIVTQFFTTLAKNSAGQEFLGYILKFTDNITGKITWMFINDPSAGFKNVGTVFEQHPERNVTVKGTEMTTHSGRNSAFNAMKDRIFGTDFHRCKEEYQRTVVTEPVGVPVAEPNTAAQIDGQPEGVVVGGENNGQAINGNPLPPPPDIDINSGVLLAGGVVLVVAAAGAFVLKSQG